MAALATDFSGDPMFVTRKEDAVGKTSPTI
jgi:hypothetical protein